LTLRWRVRDIREGQGTIFDNSYLGLWIGNSVMGNVQSFKFVFLLLSALYTAPGDCTFDNDATPFCDWSQDPNDDKPKYKDFMRGSSTPSNKTGPSTDVSGSGKPQRSFTKRNVRSCICLCFHSFVLLRHWLTNYLFTLRFVYLFYIQTLISLTSFRFLWFLIKTRTNSLYAGCHYQVMNCNKAEV